MRLSPSGIRMLLFSSMLILTGCADDPVSPDRVHFEPEPASSHSPDSLRSIAVGYNHACGLDMNGLARCWGFNPGGFVLGRTTTDECGPSLPCDWRPGLVRGRRSYTHLAAGDSYTCGIESGTQHVYCWGWSWALGSTRVGTQSQAPVRVQLGSRTFEQVTAGESHACALETEGFVWCWGLNNVGAVGAPDSVGTVTQPRRVPGQRRYAMVAAGGWHTCAIGMPVTPGATGGPLYCWGNNSSGQLGVAYNEGLGVDHSTTPLRVPTATDFVWVAAGPNHVCGIRHADSRVYCWGSNASGQSGHGQGTGPQVRPILSSATFRQVGVAGNHSCGLETSGHITCWGTGTWGELGNGDSAATGIGRVAGSRTYTTLATGGHFNSCATDASGGAYCWGANQFGQAGEAPWQSGTCYGMRCVARPEKVGRVDFAPAFDAVGRSCPEILLTH